MAHNEPTKDGRRASSNDIDLILWPALSAAKETGCTQGELEKAAGDQAHRVIGRLTDLLDAGIVDHPQDEMGAIDFRRFVVTAPGRVRLRSFYDVAARLKAERERVDSERKKQQGRQGAVA